MTPKTFIALGVAAVVSVGAAAMAVGVTPHVERFKATGKPLFPEIAKQINDITSFKIVEAERTMTFEKKGDKWVLKQANDYPAKTDQIAKALVALSQLKLLEPKTTMESRYAKLQLQDPTKKGAMSQLVTIKNSKGDVLGAVILGKANNSLPQTVANGGVYVRLPGKKQTWLAGGNASFQHNVRDWIDRDIVNIKEKRIRKVTVHHPDGEVIVISKDKPDSKSFHLENMPNDRQPRQSAIEALASVPDGLLLNDVKPKSQIDLSKAKTVDAVYQTFDGLQLDAKVSLTGDGKSWLVVDASAPGAKPDSKVAKEAKKINERVHPWVYELPDWQGDQVRRNMQALTDPIDNSSKSSTSQ